jgi:2-phospho-L-lactate transferase/gluconeogenesis factor (CofD/UPF0052 family)
LDDHAIGNLLIVGLWERLGDPVAGLDMVAKLLGAKGRVLPMASVPLEIAAEEAGRDFRNPRPSTSCHNLRGSVLGTADTA